MVRHWLRRLRRTGRGHRREHHPRRFALDKKSLIDGLNRRVPPAARLVLALRVLYDGLWLLPAIRHIPPPWRKWMGLALLGLDHISHEGLWVVPFVPLTLSLKVSLGVLLCLLGEISWWLGVLILGKELLAQYQRTLVRWIERILGEARLARVREFLNRWSPLSRWSGHREVWRK